MLRVRDPIDLAAISLALAGACFGFLVERLPGEDLHGDSLLAIGGAVAGLAILTRTELLSLLLGGMFVIIKFVCGSSGRLLQTSGGRAVQDPLHHHFEMKGWASRPWWSGSDIAGVLAAAGIGTFYAEWVGQ